VGKGAPRTADPQFPLDTFLDRVHASPGVAGATATSELPAAGYNMALSFAIEGRRAANPNAREDAQALHVVTPEYFRVLGVPVRRGRAFDARDDANAPRVAIVNESWALGEWCHPARASDSERVSGSAPPES
jgi:hypothetical protein